MGCQHPKIPLRLCSSFCHPDQSQLLAKDTEIHSSAREQLFHSSVNRKVTSPTCELSPNSNRDHQGENERKSPCFKYGGPSTALDEANPTWRWKGRCSANPLSYKQRNVMSLSLTVLLPVGKKKSDNFSAARQVQDISLGPRESQSFWEVSSPTQEAGSSCRAFPAFPQALPRDAD